MDPKINAIHVNDRDSCVTSVCPIAAGELVAYHDRDGSVHTVCAAVDIPAYHKVAVCDVAVGDYVIKYGEQIGVATQDIRTGDYVHIHNVRPLGQLH